MFRIWWKLDGMLITTKNNPRKYLLSKAIPFENDCRSYIYFLISRLVANCHPCNCMLQIFSDCHKVWQITNFWNPDSHESWVRAVQKYNTKFIVLSLLNLLNVELIHIWSDSSERWAAKAMSIFFMSSSSL